jgi:plastocyanin
MTATMQLPRTTAVALLLLASSFAACGGNDETKKPAAAKRTRNIAAATPAGTVLKVAALKSGGGAYRFDVKRLKANQGAISIEFDNGDAFPHNVRVQTGSKCCFGPQNRDVGGTQTIDGGARTKATVTLKPGHYVFLCSIGGHWNGAGSMTGTLEVS